MIVPQSRKVFGQDSNIRCTFAAHLTSKSKSALPEFAMRRANRLTSVIREIGSRYGMNVLTASYKLNWLRLHFV